MRADSQQRVRVCELSPHGRRERVGACCNTIGLGVWGPAVNEAGNTTTSSVLGAI